MNDLITNPIVQYGFLGLSGVLLVIIVWLIRCLLEVMRESNRVIGENNRVIQENTEAVHDVTVLCGDVMSLNRSVHDKLLARPCIAQHEG